MIVCAVTGIVTPRLLPGLPWVDSANAPSVTDDRSCVALFPTRMSITSWNQGTTSLRASTAVDSTVDPVAVQLMAQVVRSAELFLANENTRGNTSVVRHVSEVNT